MKIKTWVARFFKCSFVLKVGTAIFELDNVSMSNFVKFEFWSMTFKIERVFKKRNKMLSHKLAKRAMNLVSKKEHKNAYMRKKCIFFCKIKSLYTIINLCVVIKIIASYFPYGLKMMSRNTLSEPQPDSAS